MNRQLGGLRARRASPSSSSQGRGASGQKSGRPLTPKRPAFAFLVTPKLPLGGRSVKLNEEMDSPESGAVNHKFAESTTF